MHTSAANHAPSAPETDIGQSQSRQEKTNNAV